MRKPFLQPQQPKSVADRQILTVSQLNCKAKAIIESNFTNIWIEGEISNFIKAASGHWYFSLKDESAQIKGAMFKFKNKHISFTPSEGDKVLVKGKVSLYEARGDYQLIADYMEPSGVGKLQQELTRLVTRLESEGLFSKQNKKQLPNLPRAIGVITSGTGAAIHDVLTVLKRRCPMVPVVIYPTQVQGAAASKNIIESLKTAQLRNECDVLLMTRGGGSLEDLWCFNNEQLTREIHRCTIPIVAAIGHEVDVTITELAADLRAATPSAAAELLVPEQQTLWQKIDWFNQDIIAHIRQKINAQQVRLNTAKLKLRDPERQILMASNKLTELNLSLKMSYECNINKKRTKLEELSKKLKTFHPRERLLVQRHRLDLLANKLKISEVRLLESKRNQLSIRASLLDTLSPLSTLARGYSITRDRENKRVIVDASQVKIDQELTVLLSQGEISCRVTSNS
ncbi:MAG: exodeoxyribonuclease VII large subunit [Kangiellaceae bacterium]|nr:exodeoxyribonuclease VII large subunit [Kangiellaceae bacterium]